MLGTLATDDHDGDADDSKSGGSNSDSESSNENEEESPGQIVHGERSQNYREGYAKVVGSKFEGLPFSLYICIFLGCDAGSLRQGP